MRKTKIISIDIKKIRRDPAMQVRAGLDAEVVADWAVRIVEGLEFPPVILVDDGKVKWLTDGFTRIAAMEAAGRKHIYAEVRKGTRTDALVSAATVNSRHGNPLTDRGKRNAVVIMLDLLDSGELTAKDWSNVKLAKHCGCTEGLVRLVKLERNTPAAPLPLPEPEQADRSYNTRPATGSGPDREPRQACEACAGSGRCGCCDGRGSVAA